MSQPDAVSIEDAYASALLEIGRLQERLLLNQAQVIALKREVKHGQESTGYVGNVGSGDSPHSFLD